MTGQYYLRARYYNPLLGRFMQEDVYQGDGLNLYAYCHNNPVMYYDPSGYTAKDDYEKAKVLEGIEHKEGTIINSTGEEVTRTYVMGEDELLQVAENAAQGSLDDWIYDGEDQWTSPDKTMKIEWNMEGHSSTNEGPHVTIRIQNEKGSYNVIDKFFIWGRDTFKKIFNQK